MMRRILIDTDTASDDAVAIVAALRDDSVRVEAITVVAGNVPLERGVKNALISVQTAQTYAPPVYRGAAKPMMRALHTSEYVHGDDGMGNMDLPEPVLQAADGHAVDTIIALAAKYAGELEIVTLGPLTNLALAYLREPAIAEQIKRVTIMGGQGLGAGNITPVAEFNIYVDAEAAYIVTHSGMTLTYVGWDVSTDETFVTQEDIDALLATNSPIAYFCVRCNEVLQAFNLERSGRIGFDLPDPVTLIAAIYPDIVTHQFTAYASVEYHSADTYGQVIIDRNNVLKRPHNVTICAKVDEARFKQILFKNIV